MAPEAKWLGLSGFISFLLKYRVVDRIFINCTHCELIKRSYELLKTLAEYGKLNKSLLTIIWNNSQGKHEEIMRATLDILQKLALNLKLDGLKLLFTKVKEIPNENYNEMLVDFLKEYTKSAMLNYARIKREGTGSLITDTMSMFSRKNESVDSQQYFNLDKLWVLTFAS